MIYKILDLNKEVRIAMDQNATTEFLSAHDDIETLSLDDIITSKIEDAAKYITANAPSLLLDSGKNFGDSVGWFGQQKGYGGGYINLPEDFLRLVTFQMSDWSRAVTMPIDDTSPLYDLQKSRFPGVRGCPQKPVVAIVQMPIGLVLEFYSCTSGNNAYVKRARYIPIPKIVKGEIDLCEKLKRAIVYYTAYLTCITIGEGELAQVLLNTTNELLK